MTDLKIQNLTSGYGRGASYVNVLNDVSQTACAGQLIILLGPNGSGKSTLLKTLAGLINLHAGDVFYKEVHLNRLCLKARAKTIAYLAQDRSAPLNVRVRDIVEIGRAPYRGSLGRLSPVDQNAVERALRVAQALEFQDRFMGTLSGGEQARVLLARALAVDAPILLADEPIAALDPYYQITMMETLKAEALRGRLVITALHDLALATQFADTLWILKDGQIASSGPPETALTTTVLKSVFRIDRPENGFTMLHTR